MRCEHVNIGEHYMGYAAAKMFCRVGGEKRGIDDITNLFTLFSQRDVHMFTQPKTRVLGHFKPKNGICNDFLINISCMLCTLVNVNEIETTICHGLRCEHVNIGKMGVRDVHTNVHRKNDFQENAELSRGFE